MRCVVFWGSTSFPWLVFFFEALLWGSMIHKHTGRWMWHNAYFRSQCILKILVWNKQTNKQKHTANINSLLINTASNVLGIFFIIETIALHFILIIGRMTEIAVKKARTVSTKTNEQARRHQKFGLASHFHLAVRRDGWGLLVRLCVSFFSFFLSFFFFCFFWVEPAT